MILPLLGPVAERLGARISHKRLLALRLKVGDSRAGVVLDGFRGTRRPYAPPTHPPTSIGPLVP